ncbi:hypothetical protein KC331_g12082, partial [Hortaea werneckii]
AVLKAKKKDGVRTKYDRMFERKNQDVFADHYAKMIRDDEAKANGKAASEDGESDAGDDLFAVKRRIPAETGSDSPSSNDEEDEEDAAPTNEAGVDPSAKTVNVPGAKQPLVLDSKRREKLLKSKKKLLKLKDQGKKVVFDEEGQPHQLYELEDEDQFKARGAAEDQRKRFLEEEKERVQKADEADKATAKEKKKAKREKRKERERAEAEGENEDADDAADGPPLEDTRADFANFLNSLGGEEDGDREQESGDEEAPKSKKQKKWFQKDDESDEDAAPGAKRARRDGGDRGGKEIETFDDLEAEAAKLLG